MPKTLLEFYAETYTLFTSLQRIVVTGFKLSSPDIIDGPLELDRLLGPPGAETIGHMSRLVGMYLDELLKLRDEQALDVSPSVPDTNVVADNSLLSEPGIRLYTRSSICHRYSLSLPMGEVKAYLGKNCSIGSMPSTQVRLAERVSTYRSA